MSMTGNMQVDALMRMRYEIYGNGEIVVHDQFSPKSDFAKEGGLEKVGSRMILNSAYDNFKYYDRGPWDTYTDRKTHGAKDAIAWTVTNQLFVGAYPTQFEPDSAMTRGMLVTVLYRLAGQPAVGQSKFTDIPADAYYKNAVAWASDLGLVAGIGNGKFAPDANVTYGQLAVLLNQEHQPVPKMQSNGQRKQGFCLICRKELT